MPHTTRNAHVGEASVSVVSRPDRGRETVEPLMQSCMSTPTNSPHPASLLCFSISLHFWARHQLPNPRTKYRPFLTHLPHPHPLAASISLPISAPGAMLYRTGASENTTLKRRKG